MSKTIDERVVSMQFDNRHFESNVKDTMSTLDKLKAKLNFTGATKGLDEVNKAANKIDMSGLNQSVQTVHAKFSALEVMGITALSRITNAAITAGTNMVKALTITPVTTGWNEYELKMNSIKTIMAGSGESLETVNKYLNELNEYSDKTIYSFSDMTQNIGKFTNAGVKLEDAVLAIKGIANEAAVSGANANEASRAMYNFAQALSAGYVKLIDWKSIELANMATVEFKEQLIESAVAAGTLTKRSDGLYETLEGKAMNATTSFNDSLQDQWMTTEVLISTLGKYADETTDIGAKASKAATQVTTFTKMMEALKETAQSGWARTWEIVFGDLEEGTTLWTKINDVISKVLETMADARNAILDKSFNKNSSSWIKISEQVEKAGINVDEFKEKLLATGKKHDKTIASMIKDEKSFNDILDSGKITKEMFIDTIQSYVDEAENASASTVDMTEKLEYFRKVVKQVWRGDYDNGAARIKALADAGYEYAVVQDLVNKTVDDHTVNLEDLTDIQLEHIGYTKEEIEAIRLLGKQAKESGSDLNTLLEDLSKPSGRMLLLESFSNVKDYLSKVFESIKTAWDNVFDGEFSLYGIIEAFHSLTESMEFSEENATRLTNILQGVFSAIDISWSLASATFMSFLKVLDAVLKLLFGDALGVGGVLEYVANKITALNEWIETSTIFGSNTKWKDLAAIFVAIGQNVKACVDAFLALKPVQDLIAKIKGLVVDLFGSVGEALNILSVDSVVNAINKIFTSIKNWINSLANSEHIGYDLIVGIGVGLANGVTMLVQKVITICTTILETICDFFGIASPSKVMIAIGGFLILGLTQGIEGSAGFLWDSLKGLVTKFMDIITLGIQNGIPFAVEVIKTFATKMLDAIKDAEIDMGSLIVAGTLLGTIYILKKILDVLQLLAKPFENVAKISGSINSAIETVSKSLSTKIKTEAFYNVAKGIAILAIALAVLSKMDQANLWSSVGAITVLAGIMAGLMLLLDHMKKLENFGDLIKFSGSIISISAALLIMAASMKIIASINPSDGDRALMSIAVMIGGMAALLWAFGTFMKDVRMTGTIDKAGALFTSMAIAVAILAVAMKSIAKLSWGDIGKGLTVIAGISVVFTLLTALTIIAGPFADRAGGMFWRAAIAIGILAVAMKLIGTMSYEDIVKGLSVVAGIGAIFALLTGVSLFAGQFASNAGTMLLQASLGIALIAVAMKTLASISEADIDRSMAVVREIGLMFTAMTAWSTAAGLFRTDVSAMGSMLLKMAGGIAVLAIAMKLIAGMSVSDMAKGVVAIGLLTSFCAGLMYMSTYLTGNGDPEKVGKMIWQLSLSVLVLAGAIAILSILDPKDIAVGVAAIASLMTCFAALIAVTYLAKDCTKTLVFLIGAVAGLVLAVTLLAALGDTDKILKVSAALTAVIGAFALLVAASKFAQGSLGTIIVMTASVGALAFVLKSIAELPIETTLNAAASLLLLIIALGASFALIGTVGKIAAGTIVHIATMTVAVGLLAAILWALSELEVEPSLEMAASLSVLLLAMSAAFAIFSTVGAAAGSAIVAAAAFDAVVIILAALLKVLGDTFGDEQSLEQIQKGIDVFTKISLGLGNALGSFFSGLSAGLLAGLPLMGSYIGQFMTNLQPFIEGAKEIKPEVFTGIATLAKAVLALTAADVIDALTSKWTGGNTLGEFGKQLPQLGTHLAEFSTNLGTFDAAKIKTVKSAMKALTDLVDVASKIPNEGGLVADIFGDNGLGTFAGHLSKLGTELGNFATNVGTFDETKVKAVEVACDAIKDIVSAVDDIPNEGGLLSKLMGENSLGTWSGYLAGLGTGISNFATNLGAFDESKITTIDCACRAITSLAEASNKIPNEGGWISKLIGENSVDTWSGYLAGLGTGIATFASNLGTFDESKVTTVKCACNAIKALASANESIPNEGGWLSKIVGENSLSSFTKNLGPLGTNLHDFVTNLGTFTDEQVKTVTSAIKAINALTKLANADLAGANATIGGFGKNIIAFAGQIKSFTSAMAEISVEALSGAIKTINDLLDLNTNVASANITALSTFGETLEDAAEKGVDGFVGAFKASTALSDVKSNTNKLVKTAADNLKSEENIKKAKSAGKSFVKGFAEGISNNVSLGEAAAQTLGSKTLKTLKQSLLINSPSKATRELGGYAGEGLVLGIKDWYSKATTAARGLGDSVRDGLSSTIARVSEAISSDVDAQPTIRPVLDLSEVTAGAGSINSLFNTNPSMGVLANVSSIGSMMNSRQNGTGDDVVSAINRLGKSLGNSTGDTYNINGITYDDGSNITSAVRELVRAAKIERRV